MDNALSQKAEDTLSEFAAVKKAEVNFQTSLGNRKGQLGINLIGAFAERQNNAFGWQVRVYGAQQDGKGYDAKLRLNIPNAKFLKAAVDYYNFGDEHGAESDDGFRYGAEAHLIPGLRLGVFYDDGGEELGGEVSYIHTIGEEQQSQTANEQWTPDLFAAVSREHSQRIVSVGNASSPPPMFSAFNNNRGTVGFSATIGAISIFAGYFSNTATATMFNPLSQELTASNGTLIWQPATRGAQTLSIAVSDLPPSQTATLLITTAIALAESGHVANVRFTVGFMDNISYIVVTSIARISVTLTPAITASRPYVLTIMRFLNREWQGIATRDRALVSEAPGLPGRVGERYSFSFYELRAWTITIVEGSEQIQSTLYAQADMPGFSPPSFPQMAELAFAANPRIFPSFPPFYRHSRAGGNQLAAGRRMLMAQSAI